MPKSAKKRKEKAADFSKTKLKLGKGKQTATNAIDTSFKARSIALPTQSIAVQKDESAPTTKRRLTFDNLISQLKHYSPSTRKDAILGLRELLEAHWILIESSLTTLLNTTVRIIGDEDASVRKALLSFFSWLLPRIPSDDLIPHSPLLLLFTTSAQTHIFPEIRIDAIKFLDGFLDCIPRAVVEGWNESQKGHGSRVLEGYLGILNAGTKYGEHEGPMKATSTASVALTPASKLIVLQSLSRFLGFALAADSFSNDTNFEHSTSSRAWYLANSFSSPEAYRGFEQLLQPPSAKGTQYYSERPWQAEVDPEDELDDFLHEYPLAGPSSYQHWTLSNLTQVLDASGGVADIDDSHDSTTAFVAHLARTLHSTLIAAFLDSAPAVFSPSTRPSETEVQLVITVAQIVRTLYGTILQGSEAASNIHIEDLESILGYMMPYFPFRPSGGRDIKLEQAFQDLNVIFCELTSLLIITSQHDDTSSSRRSKAGRAASSRRSATDKLSVQALCVSEYIIKLLRGEGGSSQIATQLSPVAYSALLPTIWALLNNPIANHQSTISDVLQATADHAVKTPSKSVSKGITIGFMARLVLLDTESQYRGIFRIGKDIEEDKKFENWLIHLPQTLWELGATNLSTTEMILRALLRTLQHKSRLLHADVSVLSSLRSRLMPYFSFTHAVRGQMLGPYSKLASPSIRRLALDVAASLLPVGGRDQEGMDGLASSVGVAVIGTEEQSYWAHVKTLRGSQGAVVLLEHIRCSV